MEQEKEKVMENKVMYSQDGCEISILTKLEDGTFIGYPYLQTVDEYGDDVVVEGPLTSYAKLYSKRPSYKEHPDAKKREAELARLASEIEKAEEKLALAKEGISILSKLPNAEQLRLLIDISNGVPAWVVKDDYFPTSKQYPDDFRKASDYERDESVPAISYRKTFNHKDGRWNPMRLVIHGYSDGSGSQYDQCEFFRTKEEADKRAGVLLVELARKTTSTHAGTIQLLEERLSQMGLEYPPEFKLVLENLRLHELTETQKQINALQNKAESLQTKTEGK